MGTSRRYRFTRVDPASVGRRRLPTLPPPPPDPMGRAPVELDRAPGPLDDPERTRNLSCVHVDHCLDVASRWAGFSCTACQHFTTRAREIDHFGARRTE